MQSKEGERGFVNLGLFFLGVALGERDESRSKEVAAKWAAIVGELARPEEMEIDEMTTGRASRELGCLRRRDRATR